MKIEYLFITIFVSSTISLDLSKSHFKSLEHEFENIMKHSKHLKKVSRSEKEFRKALFFENVALIEEYNLKNKDTKLGVNQFSVMTTKERKVRLGIKPTKSKSDKKGFKVKSKIPRKHSKEIENTLPIFEVVTVESTVMVQATESDLLSYELNFVNFWKQVFSDQRTWFDDYLRQVQDICLMFYDFYSTDNATTECRWYYYDDLYPYEQGDIIQLLNQMDTNLNNNINNNLHIPGAFQNLKLYYPDFRLQMLNDQEQHLEDQKDLFQIFLNQQDPSTITDNTDPNTPADNTDPNAPTDNTDPSEPTDNTDPNAPTDNTDPSEPTDNTDPNAPTDNTDPSEPTDNTDPNQPTDNTDPVAQNTLLAKVQDGTIPQSVDWVASGKVTPIKDQGQCGSCWSFATTGMIESAHAIKYGNHIDLSEQFLVDCSNENHGCNGGSIYYASEFILNEKTVNETSHPYNDDYNPNSPGVRQCPVLNDEYNILMKNNLNYTSNILEFLKVLKDRPVTVIYHASNASFEYRGGVISKDDLTFCPSNGEVNHGVIAVGYHIDNQQSWIKFKNSWGSQWGESGYFRMEISNEINDNYLANRQANDFGTCKMLQYTQEVIWAEVV